MKIVTQTLFYKSSGKMISVQGAWTIHSAVGVLQLGQEEGGGLIIKKEMNCIFVNPFYQWSDKSF